MARHATNLEKLTLTNMNRFSGRNTHQRATPHRTTWLTVLPLCHPVTAGIFSADSSCFSRVKKKGLDSVSTPHSSCKRNISRVWLKTESLTYSHFHSIFALETFHRVSCSRFHTRCNLHWTFQPCPEPFPLFPPLRPTDGQALHDVHPQRVGLFGRFIFKGPHNAVSARLA